ncbi:MAG: addiction module protein [Bacteroidota bacterium]|nr:addiction module protein [Bacteroidota bacterium]
MPESYSSIKHSAMSLPVKQREELANELFDSLTDDAQKEIELAWIKEAEVRYDSIVSGKAETIPGETVSKKIKEMLG